ncbi:MAG: ribosomal L7Ae/L30e/S12e/Gadd45 family protein [Gemmatimonadales bacterium]|jgi:ribosomal protein L7Ae-like RNA K-turn-binding protein
MRVSDDDLGLLGLGARAGTLVVGTGGVRAALQRDELALVIVASDASARTGEKVLRLAGARGVRTMTGPASTSLGARLGRGAVQAVGVRDARLAAGIGGE